MLCETISKNVYIGPDPSQDMYLNSSLEELNRNKIIEKFSPNFKAKAAAGAPFNFPLSQSDYSSFLNLCGSFTAETMSSKIFYEKIKKEKIEKRVERIIDKLIIKDEFFKGLDKTKMLGIILEMLNEIPLKKIKISANELQKRIKDILLLEIASGILNELTPQELNHFDEIVKRRPIFK